MHLCNTVAIRRPICAWFGPDPEPTRSGPNPNHLDWVRTRSGTKIGSITSDYLVSWCWKSPDCWIDFGLTVFALSILMLLC